MKSRRDSIFEIRVLDELSYKKTWINDIHPLSKFLVTMLFIILVLSFDSYEIRRLIPFFVYPIVIFALGNIPIKSVMNRMIIGMGFVMAIGLFNPLVDRSIRYVILGLSISGGWLSFIALMIKGALTIVGTLLLVATTGMNKLVITLKILKIPPIFILQFLLTYRYISVLIEEVTRTYHAYMLRAPGQKGIAFRSWGTLCGQIIISTFNRAERIYEAMLLRGFRGDYSIGQVKRWRLRDTMYVLSWLIILMAFRWIDMPQWIGTLATGGR